MRSKLSEGSKIIDSKILEKEHYKSIVILHKISEECREKHELVYRYRCLEIVIESDDFYEGAMEISYAYRKEFGWFPEIDKYRYDLDDIKDEDLKEFIKKGKESIVIEESDIHEVMLILKDYNILCKRETKWGKLNLYRLKPPNGVLYFKDIKIDWKVFEVLDKITLSFGSYGIIQNTNENVIERMERDGLGLFRGINFRPSELMELTNKLKVFLKEYSDAIEFRNKLLG
jgi:hypothetical protein